MNILFMCTYNSCRSQIAEGLAKNILPEDTKVFSAGLYAAGVNPTAVKALAEIGIDISGQHSKTYEDVPLEEIDLLITLCDIVCPFDLPLPKKCKRLHWPTEDPARSKGTEEEILAAFRRVRDALKLRIERDLALIT